MVLEEMRRRSHAKMLFETLHLKTCYDVDRDVVTALEPLFPTEILPWDED